MSKNLKKMLEEKLQQNNQRHNEAVQAVEFSEGKAHKLIAVDTIEANPFQPRRIFPQAELEKLAASIAEIGLLEPIIVRKIDSNRYQIAAGERRWRACKLLNKNSIEALVSNISDSDMAVFALAENIDREDLSDYEIGLALRQIEQLFPSKTKLAESFGLNREDMYRYFAFDALPDFMRCDLDTDPRLLSRSAANEIKRLLKQRENSPFLTDCLTQAWALLLAGELEQTKLATYTRKKIDERNSGITTQNIHHLHQAGKKVGNISFDHRHITVKIASHALSRQQEQQLKMFLDNLLN